MRENRLGRNSWAQPSWARTVLGENRLGRNRPGSHRLGRKPSWAETVLGETILGETVLKPPGAKAVVGDTIPQLQAQRDREMERACSDCVCSSRQSLCMRLLLGQNTSRLSVQQFVMHVLIPEGMNTTMAHKLTHDPHPRGAPHFRNRSDPRFTARKK